MAPRRLRRICRGTSGKVCGHSYLKKMKRTRADSINTGGSWDQQILEDFGVNCKRKMIEKSFEVFTRESKKMLVLQKPVRSLNDAIKLAPRTSLKKGLS
ncbi:hypothetical protein Tco_0585250 [Tanacetum coccineum]